MTIANILRLLGFSVDALADFLRAVGEKWPEVQQTATELIEKLYAPLTAENLWAVARLCFDELLKIGQGKLEPRDHPSDGA